MLSVDDIKDWNDLKEIKFHSLILGNGASISVSENFNYSSLYEKAFNDQEELINIFEHYETKDFEFVLDKLWHTNKINKFLKIDDNDKVFNKYKNIQERLIETIINNHVNYNFIFFDSKKIYEFIKQFRFVFSLNYDLVLYWSFLEGNDHYNKYFKDCFINNKFEDDWEYLNQPHPNADGVTLIFYPHGNLVLAKTKEGFERKISAQKDDLLEDIFDEWSENNSRPLFVSEGSSKKKLETINRSKYLSTVYFDMMTSIDGDICIYGWSLSKNDIHIIKQLFSKNNNINKIAISIYKKNVEEEELLEQMEEIKMRVRKYARRANMDPEIIFFDASSDGCWIN